MRLLLAREVDHEAVEGGDGDVAEGAGGFLEHFHAFFDGEEGILDRVDEDADGEVFEELGAALNEVDVTVGGRVEGAGIEGFYAHWGGSMGILAVRVYSTVTNRTKSRSHAVASVSFLK